MLNPELFQLLKAHREESEQIATAFHSANQQALNAIRAAIEATLLNAVAQFETTMAELSGANPLCIDLAHRTADYVTWMRWALGDLPYYALALGLDETSLPDDLGPCIQVYVAGRVLDDFLDRHYLYRGRRYTLLSSLAEETPPGGHADALTVLMGLLLLVDGLAQLDSGSPNAGRFLRQIVLHVRATMVGTVMDRSGPENWTHQFYEQLIVHKNVDYWLILYDALDPGHASPLCPILKSYYALAQKLNDLQDYDRDELQGAANIVSVFRRHNSRDSSQVLAEVESDVAAQLLSLWKQSRALPETARAALSIKLSETYDLLAALGLFKTPEQRRAPSRIGLAWFSSLEEFVQRLGVQALELADCPICSSGNGRGVFRKQGFQFNRCPECSHLFVSPRLAPRFAVQLAAESTEDAYDPFLHSQRIYAESICRVLRQHSYGQRLLDVGHGEGHLLLAARALGFQVYGLDSSHLPRAHLQELLGDRLARHNIELEPLPWGSFDHVLMSHVLEHLYQPRAVLEKVHRALNQDGLLYIAVPDSDSLQFRLLGKTWDAVTPIAHCQFFNESSLAHLLRNAGFEPIERVRFPALVGARPERWMRLFRRLGGEEAGELALLARKIAN